VLHGDTLWHVQRVQWINISYLNSPPPPFSYIPHSRNNFTRYISSIYIHAYTVFTPYSPSYLFPISTHLPVVSIPPDRTCSGLLSDFQKNGKGNDIFACLREIHKEFSCGLSMYVCVCVCVCVCNSSTILLLSTLVSFL
jgi:hypothetical protein